MRVRQRLRAGDAKGAAVKTDVRRVTKTDALIAHINSLGCDKFFTPIGIRTTALAEATGVPAKSIQALLDPRVKSGELVVCKITGASGQQEREYRVGPGVPPPEFKPLDTRRNGVALRTPATRPTAAPSLSTPKPPADQIAAPVFIKSTQPAVVKAVKTPAAGGAAPPLAEPAVTAQATPGPTPRAALKKEPTAVKAPAGNVRIGINAEGILVIAIDDDSIELNQKQACRLGNFMVATQGVWAPF